VDEGIRTPDVQIHSLFGTVQGYPPVSENSVILGDSFHRCPPVSAPFCFQWLYFGYTAEFAFAILAAARSRARPPSPALP